MAQGEEDYMGDLSQFLPPEEASCPPNLSSNNKDLRSCQRQGLYLDNANLRNRNVRLCVSNNKSTVSKISNQKRKVLNWQEERKLKRKQKQMEEDQQTLANLESAIPQSNIGFKLLKQMGYTPGSTLGKEGSGRAEPLGLEIRRGRAGIGKEDPVVEKMRRDKEVAELMTMKEQELMGDFEGRLKERWRERRIAVNFRKAEAALAQLENRDVVEVEKNEEDGEKKEEEEEEEITEEDLQNILIKLRDKYCYCLFCGCQYELTESLLSNCPGINEDDH